MLHGPQTLRGSGRWGGPAGGRAPSGHLGLALGRRGDFVVASIKRGSGRSHARLRIAALLAGVSLSAVAAQPRGATWLLNATVPGPVPGTFDFNAPANWSPPTFPSGPTGTATFDKSNAPNLSFSASTTTVGGWTFNAGASNYSFTNESTLEFGDAGIVINGGSATITNRVGGLTRFINSSSAGSATIVNRFGGTTFFSSFSNAGAANITNRFGGLISFFGSSSAGNSTITNNSSFGFFLGAPFGLGFFDTSTAGTATITNNNNGLIFFGTPFGIDTPSADHATIVNNSGSETDFNAFSTAGNATITTNSGAATVFFDNSTGGLARFIVNGSGVLNFSFPACPNGNGQISAGSIEGNGQVFIGGNNTLSVGGNNLSTEFSGVIADSCGCGPPGPGSLVKVGTGTLILSGANTYTGTTDVNGGTLIGGSIASSSLTSVNNGGALGGTGVVGNTLINGGGIFAPGSGTSGSSMTIAGNLAFQSGGLCV